MSAPRPWKTRARRVLLRRPPWLEVGEEDIELPDGQIVKGYSWITTRDFAIVVPLTDDDHTMLIRSYKHGVRGISRSFPAGYLEAGEEPLAGAKRELLEEAGWAADEWTSLGRFVVDGNYGSGTMHAFLATGAKAVARPESGDLEEMELQQVTWADAVAALERGELQQLASAAALGLAALARARPGGAGGRG
ncbi:MAG TPA: NUDIX hydrolase [Candidatus Limnocylindria bacterium]